MNDIENDINDLFDLIEQSALYKDYVLIKKQIKSNEDIKNIIEMIIRYQKIITNTKDHEIELNLKELYNKLNSYPIYQTYLIKKELLNEELFMIKEIFEKYFADILKI